MKSHPSSVKRTTATQWQRIDLADAEVRVTQFCDPAQAQVWFAQLHREIAWEQHHVRIFGGELAAPRLSCWVGDAQARYTYSRMQFAPRAWTCTLSELRERLFALCGESYNSVLCNLYRDGRDCMGWHSDDEPELGADPAIASLSFGAPRRFRLRHRHRSDQRAELVLTSGSLLHMAGTTQRCYRHDLPKTANCSEPRINLTFRKILAPAVQRSAAHR